MESEQHPSSSLLSHQHDFSSLVSWPDHWQPESFEITTNPSSTSAVSHQFHNQMTQVVPEHVARAKLASGSSNTGNTNSTYKNRLQRSNSATLSTISVTCDTDTSIRPRNTRPQQSPTKKSHLSTTTTNNLTASRSSTALMNVSVNPLPTSVRNHQQYKSSGNSSSSMSTSLTSTSGMNIIHEKSPLSSSASAISIQNKHLIKNLGAGGGGAGAVGGSSISSKSLSNKHKATSFDDHHHHHHRTNQGRGLGKSVLEHLVFVFPENVRKMLTGPKK